MAESTNPTSEAAPTEILSPDQQELSQILKSFRMDPMGIVHLGKDGIFRSLTADRDVIDAVAFPPRLVKAMLDRLPFNQTQADVFRGVDGTNTPREQWFHPEKETLPPPLSEEGREQAKKSIEEHGLLEKAKVREEGREGESEGPRCCGPVVRSDHDLGIKDQV